MPFRWHGGALYRSLPTTQTRVEIVSIPEVADRGSWDLAVPEDGSSRISVDGKHVEIAQADSDLC